MANEETKQLTLGIVGGGRGGLEMLRIFARSELVKVMYLVDRDLNAPGMVEAKALDVKQETDLVAAVKTYRTDFIIEATGSPKVQELIEENLNPGTELISAKGSLMFYNVLNESRKKTNKHVSDQIGTISEEITASTKTIKSALGGITQVALNLEMLSINAAIEAARAGEKGRSFAVVAEAVKTTAGEAKTLLGSIESVNNDNSLMSHQLEELLEALH
ncbi:MAG: methyl-accepting chemotaxis protein [Syntrophotaleaceae bacterium]